MRNLGLDAPGYYELGPLALFLGCPKRISSSANLLLKIPIAGTVHQDGPRVSRRNLPNLFIFHKKTVAKRLAIRDHAIGNKTEER
jgi:hypothetical protein